MRFAINYSPQAEELLREGRIQVDVFKCPDWRDLVARVSREHRVYVHCSLYAGRELDTAPDFAALDHWLAATDTLVINTHFAALRSEFPAGPISAEMVIKRGLQSVERLGERYGIERVVIENVPYPTGAWLGDLLPEVVDPAVIREVVERSGCGLLLDLAHAVRACEGTKRADVKAYIEAMPLHALRELHVVGLAAAPDQLGMRHDHLPMTAADWQLAEWAIEGIAAGKWRKPDTLAFEYGGIGEKFEWRSDRAVIAEQAPRLYAMTRTVQTP